jgi:UDP-glucose:(glucosyl)LPS alpha-1,2-glucosyltransferase
MSAADLPTSEPTTVAVILPPREGFGPRRARAIGLTVRLHALGTPNHRTVVFGGRQSGSVFPDVTFQRVAAPLGTTRALYALGLLYPLRRLRPTLIEVHAEPRIAMWLQRVFPTVPVVLFLHDDPFASRLTRVPARRAKILSRTARVLTVSAWLRGRFLNGVDAPGRVPIVVPPCIDLASLPRSGAGFDSPDMPISKRRARLVLFAGRLVPEKGADLFVSACTTVLPRLPGWRAEIIGAAGHGVNSVETPFTQLLRATADPAGIALLGYRDQPDVMMAMARAAIVMIPNRTLDPSGRAALEAMANGAAVICTREGALPEVAGEFAAYADASEFAAALRALGENPGRLTALARAGRERAALFDVPVIGRWLEKVREQIMADGPPRL